MKDAIEGHQGSLHLVFEYGILGVMVTGDERRVELILNDLESHDHVMGLPVAGVVKELTELLGATTVAVIGGVAETRAVQQWANGEREPQRPHLLRFALQVGLMISTFSNPEAARSWFHGSNPRLDDKVPMLLLAEKPLARRSSARSWMPPAHSQPESRNRPHP